MQFLARPDREGPPGSGTLGPDARSESVEDADQFMELADYRDRLGVAHLFLAEVYEARGKREEAAAERERARALGAR